MKIIKNELVKELDKVHSYNCIENYKDVLEFICNDRKRSIRLTKKSKEEFTDLFGRYNFTFKGSEFFNYVWALNYKDEEFVVYISERGTQFTIKAKYEDKKSKIILEFLKEIDHMLCELTGVEIQKDSLMKKVYKSFKK